MKKPSFILSLVAVGVFAMPAFAARAQSCCGQSSVSCPMGIHGSPSPVQPVAVSDPQSQTFAPVFAPYLKIQAALARDSLADVTANAQAIAKAVNDDKAGTFSSSIAQQAGAVAAAQDLKSARAAFKTLSDSLIKFLADHHRKEAYVEVYCPMANAHWLQADKNVKNPYLGKEMSECGEIQN